MEIEPTDIKYKDTLLRNLAEKISISSFQVTEPSLNHIFIRQVKRHTTDGRG